MSYPENMLKAAGYLSPVVIPSICLMYLMGPPQQEADFYPSPWVQHDRRVCIFLDVDKDASSVPVQLSEALRRMMTVRSRTACL